MPSNTAAWLVAAKTTPLEVRDAPYTSPGENEIVVKNGAMAVNPGDYKTAFEGFSILEVKYPTILGHDVAGTVEEVGSSVTRFKKGDRVLGHAIGVVTQKASDRGFQEYTIVPANMASQIPSTLSFESAAVLPLGITTAAAGLFQKDYLGLEYPSLDAMPTGKTLLVWGGASSVGSNTIQLAVAAGYEVITTASPKNFEYTKKLGASQVFDYQSKTVVNDLVEALKGKTLAGALDSIGAYGAVENCLDVVAQIQSEGNKFVASTLPPPKEIPAGVTIKQIYSIYIARNEVSKLVYGDFIPKALAAEKYIAAPEPYVVGKGLESAQAGLDLLRKGGISVKKVVITL
jgi:NADPH:quinone reductase-like Zn-dependent oxidoreductase